MDSSDSSPADKTAVDRTMLRQLVVKLLQRKGMFVAEAEIVADRMIDADLRGRHRFGVGALSDYLEAMDLGDIDPRARMITISETTAIANVDGSTGMGHVAATRAMSMAVEKASAVGTGMVVIRNSRPCGDLDVIARLAACHGLIGFVASSEDPDTTPVHGLVWPDGRVPIDTTSEQGSLPFLFIQLLSAGLGGADASPRKRKANHAANAVEYALLAINPDSFGAREALTTKWSAVLKEELPVDQSATVSLRADDARTLAELAARIKFAVTW